MAQGPTEHDRISNVEKALDGQNLLGSNFETS